jgi:hypothetical protein
MTGKNRSMTLSPKDDGTYVVGAVLAYSQRNSRDISLNSVKQNDRGTLAPDSRF